MQWCGSLQVRPGFCKMSCKCFPEMESEYLDKVFWVHCFQGGIWYILSIFWVCVCFISVASKTSELVLNLFAFLHLRTSAPALTSLSATLRLIYMVNKILRGILLIVTLESEILELFLFPLLDRTFPLKLKKSTRTGTKDQKQKILKSMNKWEHLESMQN